MTAASLPSRIDFHFDPTCPWTWATSRWLVEAAATQGVEVGWRSLSLGVLNEGREIPEQYRAPMLAGAAAHRLIQALLAAGRDDVVGAFYTEFGRRVHHDGERPTTDLVREVAAASGAGEWVAALDDESWDDAVRTSTHAAVGLAGPDIGSPVISWGDPVTAIFGPIVSPPPTGEAGARLLELVVEAASTDGFFELKRGRTAPPAFGPRP